MSKIISFDEQSTRHWQVVVKCTDDACYRPATEADLLAAGYVKEQSVINTLFNVEFQRREAEAWRKIDKWLLANKRTSGVNIFPCSDALAGKWRAEALEYDHDKGEFKSGELFISGPLGKTEALEALASWCEGQA